ELTQLETAPVPVAAKTKPSNEAHFRRATMIDSAPPPTVTADANGNALLTCRVHFGADTVGYNAHFPYGAHVGWINTGLMVVSNDLVDTAISSLNGVQPITLSYARDCDETNCPPMPMIGAASLTLTTPATVGFTLDGGLAATGTLSPSVPLEWGW